MKTIIVRSLETKYSFKERKGFHNIFFYIFAQLRSRGLYYDDVIIMSMKRDLQFLKMS